MANKSNQKTQQFVLYLTLLITLVAFSLAVYCTTRLTGNLHVHGDIHAKGHVVDLKTTESKPSKAKAYFTLKTKGKIPKMDLTNKSLLQFYQENKDLFTVTQKNIKITSDYKLVQTYDPPKDSYFEYEHGVKLESYDKPANAESNNTRIYVSTYGSEISIKETDTIQAGKARTSATACIYMGMEYWAPATSTSPVSSYSFVTSILTNISFSFYFIVSKPIVNVVDKAFDF